MSDVQPLQNSNISSILDKSWKSYKEKMVEPNGRPKAEPDKSDLDKDGNKNKEDGDKIEQVTFSEAAAYTMLRASIQGDQEEFQKIWGWTSQNLQRKNIKELWTYSNDEKKWMSSAPWVAL